MTISQLVENMLEQALAAVLADDQALREALDELAAAIYVTNADGVIIYFNPACIDFTGRLYTNTGEFLPHDQCPMAVAINAQRPIRGVTAVAERPDGTRVAFRPYPTPIFDKEGRFAGAVNLLEDVTDELRADDLMAQARRCRRLANAISDEMATETLNRMADEYEAKAAELRAAPKPPRTAS